MNTRRAASYKAARAILVKGESLANCRTAVRRSYGKRTGGSCSVSSKALSIANMLWPIFARYLFLLHGKGSGILRSLCSPRRSIRPLSRSGRSLTARTSSFRIGDKIPRFRNAEYPVVPARCRILRTYSFAVSLTIMGCMFFQSVCPATISSFQQQGLPRYYRSWDPSQ